MDINYDYVWSYPLRSAGTKAQECAMNHHTTQVTLVSFPDNVLHVRCEILSDVAQASLGIVGLLTAAVWMLVNREPWYPQPSIGFPGYIYPDDETCNMYQGVPAVYTEDACVYNEDVWGSSGVDNGAYPFGDKKV